MATIGFDNQQYLTLQSAQIRERIAQFGSSSTVYAAVVLAETDGDGQITTSDVRQVMQNVLGTVTFTDAQKAAADVHANGKITSTDARQILQLALRQNSY